MSQEQQQQYWNPSNTMARYYFTEADYNQDECLNVNDVAVNSDVKDWQQ